MPDIAVTKKYGGLGSYEAYRDEIIKRAENPVYFRDAPPSPGFAEVDRPTVGFGYDLRSKKDANRPQNILSDFDFAGIPLTNRQRARILYWGGWDKDRAAQYLSDSGAAPFTEDDRTFIETLDESDRTDTSLKTNLDIPPISKAQADRLYEHSVAEAEREVDRRLHALPKEIREKLEKSDQRAVLVDLAYQQPAFIGPWLLHYLRQGDLAGAALDIAFLDNREALRDIDKRNFARAEAFLGGSLAPRTPEEARAFFDALERRKKEISRAEANRAGNAELIELYRARLDALRNASQRMLGKRAALEPRAGGELAALGLAAQYERAALLNAPPYALPLPVWRGPGDGAGAGVGDAVRLSGAMEHLEQRFPGVRFADVPPVSPNWMMEHHERFRTLPAWLASPFDDHRSSGLLAVLDPGWSRPPPWLDDGALCRFVGSEPLGADFAIEGPGWCSNADDLSDAEIGALERMVAELEGRFDRLERMLEELADTPIKVTSDGKWVGTG